MLLDQLGIAVFVEDDAPVAALERIERKVYLVDGEIGDAAGSEDDDLISAGLHCRPPPQHHGYRTRLSTNRIRAVSPRLVGAEGKPRTTDV